MHNPLVIEAIMLIAAIIVGVWSQRALPLHVDSRPILFLLCLFLGTGSALCLLLDILALLLTAEFATVQRRAEKEKGKGQRDGGQR